ncbi:hypothetical protein EGW08_011533 [Elysia chlorotica]|uniref:FDX-ACB domain-containing protein n=1 Tax=Elysia chlorotica TaxID=188477 RepID=A0A3S0ZLR9_ELYCH|nr:hypothetical protein EGW08_011533 [Elysia chlorotica]
METACTGSVLLVGDGDFSFSLSLLRHGALSPCQVTTSNLETQDTIQQHKLASSNMLQLESMGVCVLLEVDARELHTHPIVSQKLYSRIIFNFPLADRHNIKKNRALLADFFSSCSQVLIPDGQVMVTLCKGQGGTPADRPQRSWHDSWQALAMAANAGFILTDIRPFEAGMFPEYHSVGFRFQDKSFDTGGSLIHVFEMADVVSVPESIVTRGCVEFGGSTFSCSQYIADKLKRNLLEEESSPVRRAERELKQALRRVFPSTEISLRNFHDAILPGHRSRVSRDSSIGKSCVSDGIESRQSGEDAKPGAVADACTGGGGDALTQIKRQKDEDNLTRKKELAAAAALSTFVHGVDGGGDPARPQASNLSLSESQSQSLLGEMIPENPEAVYVLIKSCPRTETETEIAGDGEFAGSGSEDASTDLLIDNNSQTDTKGADDSDRNEASTDFFNTQTKGVMSDANDTGSDSDQQRANCDKVFHHRVSLLENLTSVCSVFDAGKACNGLDPRDVVESAGVHRVPESGLTDSVTIAGQCCSPLPIQAQTLPVHHELMFVHKLSVSPSHDAALSDTDCSGATCSNTQFGNSDLEFDSISSRLLSYMQESGVFGEHSQVEMRPCHGLHKLELDGMSELKVVKNIYSSTNRKDSQHENASRHVGLILKATTHQSRQFLVLVLHLDSLICHTRNIPDPRLLWSQSPKVLSQLERFSFGKPNISPDSPASSRDADNTTQDYHYRPVSLYPMKFVHDLSFWENPDSVTTFDERELEEVIRYTAGEAVVKVSLVDRYSEAGQTGRVSRCYRLEFQSQCQAFPYSASWKLQSLVRMEVARRLGVVLR